MSNLNKLDFVALEVSGRNYLKWTQDVKFHLTAKKMRKIIEANNNASNALKARD
jgi:predicted transposase YbfD/YdcC